METMSQINTLVSVIVPVFNGARYIKSFYNSIVQQDYSGEIELIFINDGSKDGTEEEVKSLIDLRNIHIVSVNQVNKGVSGARNEGIRHSKGEFIFFCDVDDILHKSFIRLMMNSLENNNADFAISNFIIQKVGSPIIEVIPTGEFSIKKAEYALEQYLQVKISCGVCGCCIRKTFINRYDINFAEGYKYSEDIHYMWRMLIYANEVSFVDDKLYYYIWRGESATSIFDKRRFQGYELINSLVPLIQSRNPDFAKRFCRFAPSRMLWSIARQAASILQFSQFKEFFNEYDLKKSFKNLLNYPVFAVRLSSLLYLLSPRLFCFFIGKYGRSTVNGVRNKK